MKTLLKFFFIVPLLFLFSCSQVVDFTPPPSDNCGNGVIDSEEECDGNNVGDQTCTDIGLGNGDLTCKSDCTFDISGCSKQPECGNGKIEGSEECDTDSFDNTCESMGFSGGQLTCTNECKIDTTSCTNTNLCGNGNIDADEACDGDNLDGRTCENLNLGSGTLLCNSDCTFDVSDCSNQPYCGNNAVEGSEECDTDNLNGQTCSSLGLGIGFLDCSSNCTFDTSGCSQNNCGNGLIDTGEGCDGDNLNGMDCTDFGYTEGVLGCTSDCQIDTGACTNNSGSCGNGVIDTGEECDQDEFNGNTCANNGFYSGTINCTSSCTLDLSGCTGQCGDGVMDSNYETCDSNDFGGATCEDYGYYSGYLTCDNSCQIDDSNCSGYCGDSNADAAGNEECDNTDLNGVTCSNYGYYYGALSCDNSCMLDSSGCYGMCGDSNIDIGYEDCDGNNFGDTCDSLGYYGGTLTCGADCNFILSDCESHGYCGDGILQNSYENCDGSNFAYSSCPDYGNYQPGTPSGCNINCDIDGCLIKWDSVYAGGFSTCGLKFDDFGNTISYCWGDNLSGQLGLGDNTSRLHPIELSMEFMNISPMGNHTCGVKADGTLWCWGKNSYGQLGVGSAITSTNIPMQVGTKTDWSQNPNSIAGGTDYTCAIDESNILWCWGANNDGQLGIGNQSDQQTPAQVSGSWFEVSANGNTTCAIENSANSYLWCWGLNDSGQVGAGIGGQNSYSTPHKVNNSTWFNASVGFKHTCAITNTNKLYCWGKYDDGRLGIGTTYTNQASPAIIDDGGAYNWITVTAGSRHTCATNAYNSIYCWGDNTYGQIGDGSSTDRNSPTLVGNSYYWYYITAGVDFTCGVQYNGTLWCWGLNNSGQLGLNSTTNTTVPSKSYY